MLRGPLAVLVGCMVMFLSTAVVTVALGVAAPDWVSPLGTAPTSFAIVHVLCGLAFAALGGAVAARLAPTPRHRWVMTMAVIAVLGSVAWTAVSLDTPQPPWYPWAVPLATLLGVASGGMWMIRRTEPVDR